MDEIGFMVRHIDDKGFLRLQALGGFDARVLFAQRVLVHTRTGQALRGADLQHQADALAEPGRVERNRPRWRM